MDKELRKEHDLGQAFRDDPDLRQFILKDVTPTGRVLGTGYFGSVEEVSYKHLVCAGKKFHETLINAENKSATEVVHKYLNECQLMSSLCHPNITEFIGLCFLPGIQLPLLVMERLETSLGGLLVYKPNLPFFFRRSLLEDIARGLLYLHSRRPPVVHRDLISENILVSSSLVAKITDMGNSCIITMRPGQMASMLNKKLLYIPPDVQNYMQQCEIAIDVFLFGHLALITLAQKLPENEVELHVVYMKLLKKKICAEHPALVELVKQCLQNDPRERPSTEELLTRLQGVRKEVKGQYAASHSIPIKLDMVKVRLAREVRENTRRLEAEEDFRRQLVKYTEELHIEIKVKNRQMAAKDLQLAMKDKKIEDIKRELVRHVEELQAEGQAKEHQIDQLQATKAIAEAGERRLYDDKVALERHVLELQAEARAKDHQVTIKQSKLLTYTLKFTWRLGPDMPFGMTDNVQSVVVQGKLYVGGGGGGGHAYIVMVYDIGSGKWTTLPQYKACHFAMAVISNQLVLVGGYELDGYSKMLGVWGDDGQGWIYPYPDMPTARYWCSVAVYNEWLVVAGGYANVKSQSCVEVLNTDCKQWYAGLPTPTSWNRMNTAVVGDMAYFMGGNTRSAIMTVYCVDIPALLSHIISTPSSGTDRQIWKKIPGLQLTRSTPLSISGCLLAVGGEDNAKAVAAIHLYHPDSGTWVKIGKLPSPRYYCACALTTDTEMLVAGGNDGRKLLKRVDIARLPIL